MEKKKNRVDFIQFDKREYPSTVVSQINLYKNKIEEIDWEDKNNFLILFLYSLS